MAQARMRTGGPGEEEPARERPDVRMTAEDRDAFIQVMTRLAANREAGARWLRRLSFPADHIPQPAEDAESWWWLAFDQLDLGRVQRPYSRLLRAVHEEFPYNPEITRLHDRYLAEADAPHDAAVVDQVAQEASCRVMVSVRSEAEREDAERQLRDLGLAPQFRWASTYTTSFATNSPDVVRVTSLLDRTDLGWTVAGPAQPDYVFSALSLQGPDGSRFIARDTPSQRTFRDVAEDVISEHYPGTVSGDTVNNAIVDRIGPGGERKRANPDETLHEAGVQDGEQMRIGFEGRAGAVNPIIREDALQRVHKQIVNYANAHPGMRLTANAETLPTVYDLEFEENSFGPPGADGEPTLIQRHRVRIQLGPDFPERHPDVFFLSPIFHPNVYPMYDNPDLGTRYNKDLRGLVCLGELDDSWYPGMDMGEVCQMVVEIAGYRNYDLIHVTGDRAAPELHANFFDKRAAVWAMENQELIKGRGGVPIVRSAAIRPRVSRSVIDRVD
ncbi:effector-associated domain EAD1-containing protein [Actinoplanes sp. NPDC051513]|uniref:effector-associated domain EAD1-containing protein n=1 Tax=Actinoplanes sp. NPDC051513 TaxID=3363908 RepID=UPI0037B87E73